MDTTPIKVLLVEDNLGDARLIVEAFADITLLTLQVEHVVSLREALHRLTGESIDVILLDLSLPDAQGENTADQIYRAVPDIPIVILTGRNDEEFAVKLIGSKRVEDYLVKGQADGPTLVRSIRYAIERKRILVALSASESHYRAIVEDQTDLICRFTSDGTLTFVNETFAHYLSEPGGTRIGQNFVSLFSGENVLALEQSIRSLSPENPTSSDEYQINTANGDNRWQQWIIRAIFNSDGALVEFQIVGRDITQRKQTEEALRESEAKFRSIVETTYEWIWTVDGERRLVYSNRAVEKMLGYPLEQLIDQKVALSVHPDDLPRFDAFWTEHMTNAQGWNGLVLRWRHKDGSYRHLESNAVPVLSLSGQVIGFRGADRDITERKQIEAEQLKFELERGQTRLFKRFVGGVSHDLRTPLTVIGTSIDLLYRMTDAEGQLKHLHKMEAQTLHIQSIVEDLYTLMRLEAETMELNLLPLNLNTIVEIACAQQSAAEKNHAIKLNLDANLHEVMGDETALNSAVKHLLVNAVNYTPQGGVIFVTTSKNDQEAVLEVTDCGVGIRAEELPLIFERFYRVDKARSTETGGSGLGLTITRKIVELHGGRIEVKSLFGQGSTFSVAIPLIGER